MNKRSENFKKQLAFRSVLLSTNTHNSESWQCCVVTSLTYAFRRQMFHACRAGCCKSECLALGGNGISMLF